MTIQINTDKIIQGNEEFRAPFIAEISEKLSRFSQLVTRLEVRLTDQNGNKDGANDKRCVMEARLEGRKPFAVTDNANTHEQAISGALSKLTTSLESIHRRMHQH